MQSESFQVWCPHLRWESKQQRVADGQKTKEIYYKWKRVHVQYSEISLSLLFITVNHACVIIHHKCKKLWFIHELTAHYTSKTAKITKR